MVEDSPRPKKNERRRSQPECAATMVGSGFPIHWDSSWDRFAPFVANLLFGKCSERSFREPLDVDDILLLKPRPGSYYTTDHSDDDDTVCAVKPDDDDWLELDDEEEEIGCAEKERQGHLAESSSFEMETGPLTSDTTDGSSSTISSTEEKETKSSRLEPESREAYTCNSVGVSVRFDMGSEESELKSKEVSDESELQSKEASDKSEAESKVDVYELDDEENDIDCAQKKAEEKSYESPSCDVQSGSPSPAIFPCEEKEREEAHQTQETNEATMHKLVQESIKDEKAPDECGLQPKDEQEEFEATSKDLLEPKMLWPQLSKGDGNIRPECRSMSREHNSVDKLSEDFNEAACGILSEKCGGIDQVVNPKEEKMNGSDGQTAIKCISHAEVTDESNGTIKLNCGEGLLDCGKGQLDWGERKLRKEAFDSQRELLFICEEKTCDGGLKADEGKEDFEDKVKVRPEARFIFPADFKLGRPFGGCLTRRESRSSRLSGSNACNVSIPKSVNSRASSIVSASRSVRSLPREIELFDIIEEDKSPCFVKKKPRSKLRKRSTNGQSEYDVHQVSCVIITDAHERKGTYSGAFSKSLGVPHGFGRFEFDSGRQWFEGYFKRGEWIRQGRYFDSNGDFYRGSFCCGVKHGAGLMKFADGRTFEGQFMEGRMVQGLMTYQDGSTYEGGWIDGLRHGHGHSVFQDNSVYVGAFREGEFSGFGKMLWMDGGFYEGEWEQGEMQGYGKEILPNGNLKHEGQWYKGKPIRNGLLGAL